MNSKIFDGLEWLINPGYGFHKILNKDLEEASKLAKGTLLDVDCGKKRYKGTFQNKVDYCVGIDLPSTSYGISEVDVFSNALQLSFRDKCFDVKGRKRVIRMSTTASAAILSKFLGFGENLRSCKL